MHSVLSLRPAERCKLVLEELEPRIAPTVLTGIVADAQQTQATTQAGAQPAAPPPSNDPLEGYSSGGLTGPVAGSPTALGLAPPGPNAVILSYVPPDYDWWYGCVPTSVGMLLAWWDQTTNSDIFPGNPNDWVYGVYPSYNPADFTHANGVVAGWNHAQVDSYLGHVPDSLADFLLTEYGGTYYDFPPGTNNMVHGLEAYVAWDDPRTVANDSFLATATLHDSMSGGWTYAEYRAEIDAGRPVMLGLTSFSAGHAVLGVGYDNTGGPHIVILDTWHDGLQEWEWTNESESGFNFTVDSGITFDMVSQPVPQLSGYLSIAHTYISDLTVQVGLGDPANPTWVETVWSGGGGAEANLALTNIDLSGALPYLDQDQQWFVDVYDGAAGDSGSIQDFQVWYGGHDGQRWFTTDAGGSISDFQHAYAHLTTSVPLLPVTLDPTTDTGLSAFDRITRNTTPLVNVTVPNAGTIWVDFNHDGTWDASVVAAAPGTYSVQSPLSLTDGDHLISAKLVDLGGNAEYGGLHLTINTQRPAAPTTMPDLDPGSDTGRYQVDNITADATPTLHVVGFGSYYQVLRDGVRVSGEYATGTTFTEPAPAADGVHNYTVCAVDEAGNISSPSPALRVTIDTTPPVVSVTVPADGSSIHSIVNQVSVTFNERMNDSLLAGNVLLEGSGGDGHFGDGNEYFVPLTLQYEVGNNSATGLFVSPLATDLYHLHVNPALQDFAGNSLDGNHDGVGGDAHVAEFRVEASYTWQQGAATVTVYDLAGPVNFRPEDIQVHFGRGDSVSSIRLGGSQSMEGVGIVIHGATSGGKISDARSGTIGNLAFIVSDSPLSGLSLRGGVSGYDLNGMTLGGITFPSDVDGDGHLDDLTSLLVTGALGTTKLTGVIGGDVIVHGAAGTLQTTAALLGDLFITGDAKALTIGGDLGHTGGEVSVGGVLGKLTVAAKVGPADLVGDLTVGSSAGSIVVGGKTTGGDALGGIEVGGLLKGLTVAGALTGDVVVHGDLAKAVVGRDLGVDGGTFQVDGILKSLTVGTSGVTGHVLSDLLVGVDLTKVAIYGDLRGEVRVGGNLGSLTAHHITNSVTVAGNLNSLSTTSTVAPGVSPDVDYVFQNPSPELEGQLLVAGSISKVSHV